MRQQKLSDVNCWASKSSLTNDFREILSGVSGSVGWSDLHVYGDNNTFIAESFLDKETAINTSPEHNKITNITT